MRSGSALCCGSRRGRILLLRAAGVPSGMRAWGWGGGGAPRVWRNSHRRLPRGQCHRQRPSVSRAALDPPEFPVIACAAVSLMAALFPSELRAPAGPMLRCGNLRRKRVLAKLRLSRIRYWRAWCWGSITCHIRILWCLKSSEGKRGPRGNCTKLHCIGKSRAW